jgi:ribosomal protein S18 acetylase RimI-like enzyme
MSEGIVIGQLLAAVHRHPDKPTELYIDDLAAAPTHQRKGIASALVERAVVIGRDAGCEEIWVLTEPDNEAANALYGSFDWRQRVAQMFEAEFENTSQ